MEMEIASPLQTEKDEERRKHSLRAIANTLKKLLTFFPAPHLSLDGTSTSPITEFGENSDKIGSSWRRRTIPGPFGKPGDPMDGTGTGNGTGTANGTGPSSFLLKKSAMRSSKNRKNLKSGFPASASSTTSSLFSRSSVLSNLMNNNNEGFGGGGGGGLNTGGKRGRPSLSLAASFDYSPDPLQLPGRPDSKDAKRGSLQPRGDNWGLFSSVDC